jgi:hypothetical protein
MTNSLGPFEALENILKLFLQNALFSEKQVMAIKQSESANKPGKDRCAMTAEQRVGESYFVIFSGMN